jgi:hypothetical protein
MSAPFTDLDERALKAMTGELVSACGGTKAVSMILGLSEPRVSGYTSVSHMDRFMPVRAVTKLELTIGSPIVSRWMSERLTRDGGADAATLTVKDLCRIVKETSDLNSVMGEALSDGIVNSADRAAIRQEIVELRLVLDALEQKVELT